MMRIFKNASNLDWQSWLVGIMRSFLSGGSSALITGGSGAIIGVSQTHILILMGSNFLLMGLYRLGEFLQLHGAPDQIQQQLTVATKEIQAAQVHADKATSAIEDAKDAAKVSDEKSGK